MNSGYCPAANGYCEWLDEFDVWCCTCAYDPTDPPLVILLTGIGAPGSPGTVQCLRRNRERPVHLIGCDVISDPANAHLVADVFQVPSPKNPKYLATIESLCDRVSVDVILPQTTAEVEFLARTKRQRRLLESTGTRVACANGHAVKRANDKASVMECFKQVGLPAPQFDVVASSDELVEYASRHGFPFVVKPRRGNGSRGVRIVCEMRRSVDRFMEEKPGSLWASLTDLVLTLRDDFPELIAMEYLPGPEYTVDCFRGLHAQEAVPRLRKATRGGITTHAVIDMRSDLVLNSLEAARHLSLTGAFGFQYRVDADGVPKVIECNPRVQGTMVASLYAGLNAPWLAVRETIMDFPQPHEVQLINKQVEYRRVWGGVVFIDGVISRELQLCA